MKTQTFRALRDMPTQPLYQVSRRGIIQPRLLTREQAWVAARDEASGVLKGFGRSWMFELAGNTLLELATTIGETVEHIASGSSYGIGSNPNGFPTGVVRMRRVR